MRSGPAGASFSSFRISLPRCFISPGLEILLPERKLPNLYLQISKPYQRRVCPTGPAAPCRHKRFRERRALPNSSRGITAETCLISVSNTRIPAVFGLLSSTRQNLCDRVTVIDPSVIERNFQPLFPHFSGIGECCPAKHRTLPDRSCQSRISRNASSASVANSSYTSRC